MKFFDGQQEHLTLSLEQVKTLALPERNQVFWAFAPKTAHSVAEVASITRKSRQTVHYHVAALIKVGLLIPVGALKKRSRTEIQYAWAAADYTQSLREVSEEFHQQSIETFRATTRVMNREVDQLFSDAKENPDIFAESIFRHIHLNLEPEQAKAMRSKIREIMKEAESLHSESPNAVRYHFLVYANPALRTRSRRGKNE